VQHLQRAEGVAFVEQFVDRARDVLGAVEPEAELERDQLQRLARQDADRLRATVTGDELREFARANLAHSKVPRDYHVVVDLPKTDLTTIQVDHGTISVVGSTSLTIAEKGSTTATVSLGKDTRVRRNGTKAAVGDLKTGDEVFVMSKVESGGTVAYLVIVAKP